MNLESLRTFLFSFIQTLIFSDLCMLRLPLVKSPHTLKMRSTNACEARAAKISRATELACHIATVSPAKMPTLRNCLRMNHLVLQTGIGWFGSERIPMYCCYVLLSAADWPVWQQEIWSVWERSWGRSPVWCWSDSCVSSAAPGSIAGFSELRAILLNLSLIQFIIVLVLLLLSGKSVYFSFTYTYRNHFTFSFTLSETKWNHFTLFLLLLN